MNLRIDHEIRIRLTEQDLQSIKNEGLVQSFRFPPQVSFEIHLRKVQTQSTWSEDHSELVPKVVIGISEDDLRRLEGEDLKQGIQLGPWNLQVDILSLRKKEKR